MAENVIPKKTSTIIRKKALLQALRKHYGLITHACEDAGVANKTYYRWLESDSEFAQAVKEIDDFVLDKVEKVAYEQMFEGYVDKYGNLKKDTTMMIFHLKTKGKKRGYIEKQEIEHSTGNLDSLNEVLEGLIDKYKAEY